jgi:hypothetical protein
VTGLTRTNQLEQRFDPWLTDLTAADAGGGQGPYERIARPKAGGEAGGGAGGGVG